MRMAFLMLGQHYVCALIMSHQKAQLHSATMIEALADTTVSMNWGSFSMGVLRIRDLYWRR